MSYTPKATNDSIKKNYDRVSVVIPAGCRDRLRQLAEAAGVSVNRYILEAVEARAGVPLTLGDDLPQIAAARARRSAAGPAAAGPAAAADGQPAGDQNSRRPEQPET